MFMHRGMVVAAMASLVALPVAAETVEEIVAKNLRARGGLDKIRAVQSVRMSGRQKAGGMEIPFTLTQKRPGKIRIEATIQGQTLVQVWDGKIGSAVVPFMGSKDPQRIPEEECQDLEEQADFDGPFVDTEKKGHRLELLGKEETEGSPVWKVKVTLKRGETRTLFLDAEEFVELRIGSKVKRQGSEIELDSYMGDYKKVGGLLFAHSVETKARGETISSVVIDKIELNVPVDDALFVMPAPSPAAGSSAAPPSTPTEPKK